MRSWFLFVGIAHNQPRLAVVHAVGVAIEVIALAYLPGGTGAVFHVHQHGRLFRTDVHKGALRLGGFNGGHDGLLTDVDLLIGHAGAEVVHVIGVHILHAPCLA